MSSTFSLTAAERERVSSIQRKFGTSYYLSTLLFPRHIQDAVFTLYGFVRQPDDLIDTLPEAEAAPALKQWIKDWNAAVAAGTSSDDYFSLYLNLFKSYAIDKKYTNDFLAAMEADCTVKRYATYEDLKGYMYGSAGVVGLMLVAIIGSQKSASKTAVSEAALELGYAMQLTNFLRDVAEDYDLRGRIYLPQEDMDAHGVTESMIALHRQTPELRSCIEALSQRARAHYQSAHRGIVFLEKDGWMPVLYAAYLYEGILDTLERKDYNVFAGRSRTSVLQKLQLYQKAKKEIATWEKMQS